MLRTVVHRLDILERVAGPADATDGTARVVRRRAVRRTVEQVGDERVGVPDRVVSHFSMKHVYRTYSLLSV